MKKTSTPVKDDQKKTRPRKEKRAPSRPAVGYTCEVCELTGFAPDEMSSATRCFDC